MLACGKYRDGTLKIEEMGFPVTELASSSRAFFGTVNTWGGRSKNLLKYSRKLAELEEKKQDHTIVFLSDCWLDDPTVFSKLSQLLKGYNGVPPRAIVLMGPFAKVNENAYALKKRFQALGEILTACERLKAETDVVLVPSSEDPMAANILPRAPLPECLIGDLKKRYPRIVLATNPCRLQYCTQQIVVCRADLVTKLCRNTIHFPQSGQLEDHVSFFGFVIVIMKCSIDFFFICSFPARSSARERWHRCIRLPSPCTGTMTQPCLFIPCRI